MLNLGMVRPGSTQYIPFDSFAGSTGASITITGLAVTDIEIYKDGSMTQRGSDNGYTLLDTDGIDIDGITGIHGFSIDLADNTTAGFYAAGSKYWVVVSAITIDGQTVNFIAAFFTIGYPDAVLNTTIATLSSQTSFTLTAGPAEDDALNGQWVIIHDVASAVQLGKAIILDYTGSTKTVTLAAGTTFTAAAADNISIMGPAPLQPATAGRTLGVESNGKVTGVVLTDTLTTYTGNTPQTGDVFPLASTEIADIKAKTDLIPAVPASTTNITAGTITTVTNLTNAPTAGDLTATMKASVQTAATASLSAFFTSAAQLVTDVWSAATRLLTAGTNIVLAKGTGVTGFNDLSAAQVNSEVDTALADYDGPTHAELVSGVNAVQASIAALNNLAAGAAMTLTAGERNSIAAALLDLADGIETGLTLRQAQRLQSAAAAGKISGAATTTVAIRNAVADSKARITATVDSDGNRTAVSTDVS